MYKFTKSGIIGNEKYSLMYNVSKSSINARLESQMPSVRGRVVPCPK